MRVARFLCTPFTWIFILIQLRFFSFSFLFFFRRGTKKAQMTHGKRNQNEKKMKKNRKRKETRKRGMYSTPSSVGSRIQHGWGHPDPVGHDNYFRKRIFSAELQQHLVTHRLCVTSQTSTRMYEGTYLAAESRPWAYRKQLLHVFSIQAE